MKDVGHAMAALLIQVEKTGQLIFAVRSVLLSERVVMAALCELHHSGPGPGDLQSIRLQGSIPQQNQR